MMYSGQMVLWLGPMSELAKEGKNMARSLFLQRCMACALFSELQQRREESAQTTGRDREFGLSSNFSAEATLSSKGPG